MEEKIEPTPMEPIKTSELAPKERGQVVVKAGTEIRALVPTTMQEAWLFCNNMAKSFNLPASFYKKPISVEGINAMDMPSPIEIATSRAMQAMQLGMEVGLPPAQAIQSVLVMNGIGTIWGDAQLALVLASGKAEYVKEYTQGEMYLDKERKKPNPAYTWICETKRKGDNEIKYTRFTIQDAIDAELWGKRGKSYDGNVGKASTWITHPDRMGMYKARAFCLRDTYPDVLKGLTHSREEMEGIVIDHSDALEITPNKPTEKLNAILEGK